MSNTAFLVCGTGCLRKVSTTMNIIGWPSSNRARHSTTQCNSSCPLVDIDGSSNPNIIFGGTVAAFTAGIEHPPRFDEQQFDLTLSIGLVFDTFRDDKHFSSRHVDCSIAEINPQSAL